MALSDDKEKLIVALPKQSKRALEGKVTAKDKDAELAKVVREALQEYSDKRGWDIDFTVQRGRPKKKQVS